MSIESDLKKDGIEVIKQLDTLKVNSIAQNVTIRLCNEFPSFNFDKNDLFTKLSRVNMYIAKMPEGMAEATYFYKNSSIYFNSHLSENNLEDYAIHECIHYIQEIKDKRNYLLRMGLCDYTEFKIYGLGLNEAAVQLMTAKILGAKKEFVKYFNISFETISSSYYPLECCLVNQLSYITGENVLFESTINSNDNFKNKLVELIGRKQFMQVQNAIDSILFDEEKIIKINNKIFKIDNRNKKVDHLIEKINLLKQSITSTFIETQNLIISSYFDNEFYKIENLDYAEEYRKKLYNFKDYLGSTEGYTYFNDYYVNKMVELENKTNTMESREDNIFEPSLSLIPKKESKLSLIFKYIKKLFSKNSEEQETSDLYGRK